MSKEPRPLAEMQERAAQVVADLGVWCERIAVAGSVRRCKPEVGDLEIVAIPRWEQSGGLFATEPVNTLYEYLNGSVRYQWLKGDNPDGKYYQLLLSDGVQLDLFLADAENFGWILLMRTGSAAFSHAMLSRWKQCQRIGPDGKGSVNGRLVTRSGQVVATPTEEDVFKLCKIAFIAPPERERGLR